MTQGAAPDPPAAPAARALLRKLQPADEPVGERSLALFRLAEACNNACPMCSNSGRPEAFFIPTEELLRRVEVLAGLGFRRVVLTGGEPTIHPGFWDVVGALRARGLTWDVNTHGRTFADPAFMARALAEGLSRAIVSFHSHQLEPSMVISGMNERGHEETIGGVAQLARSKVWLMLNCVLTRHNLDHLEAFVRWCVERFGVGYVLKIVFPSTTGKGGGWEGIDLRYLDVVEPVRALRTAAHELGLRTVFESIPNCILDDPGNRNVSRSGFGETHYLDDIDGSHVYPIRYIESVLSAYGAQCQRCRALKRCPGVARTYLERHGSGELNPMT